MGLCIKQEMLALKETFYVYNEEGEGCYWVKGKVFPAGHYLSVYDMEGSRVARIRQKLMHLRGFYEIELGEEYYHVKQKFSLFRMKVVVPEKGWLLKGNFTGHAYQILDGDRVAAQVQQKWVSLGDTYYLECADQQEELLSLAVMLAVDCMEADRTRAAYRPVGKGGTGN